MITRKFIWIRNERWVVYCVDNKLVCVTEQELACEII